MLSQNGNSGQEVKLQVKFQVKKDPGQRGLSSSIMLMDSHKQASEKIQQDKNSEDKPKN